MRYAVSIPVVALSPAEAKRAVVDALGFDEHSINDIGGVQVALVPDEKQYLVCIRCGEAFEDMMSALEHGPSDPSGSAGWCGDEGFNILPESEAL